MKRALLILIAIIISADFIFAQDIILKKDETEIKAKVTEITTEIIRYKEYDFQDGPTRTIRISEVAMIIYESGRRESFQTASQSPDREVKESSYKGSFFMIGMGFGRSYGDMGLRLQFRVGRAVGFGLHAGVGLSMFNDGGHRGKPLISGGIKFFPYRNLYINMQFGHSGRTFRDCEDYYYDDYGYYCVSSYTMFDIGPSLMTGIDMTWGKKVGVGFNIGLGGTWHMYDDYPGVAFDMGFLIRF